MVAHIRILDMIAIIEQGSCVSCTEAITYNEQIYRLFRSFSPIWGNKSGYR